MGGCKEKSHCIFIYPRKMKTILFWIDFFFKLDGGSQKTDSAFTYWFTAQMPAAAEAEPGQGRGAQARPLTWVAGTQLLSRHSLPPREPISRKLVS